MRGRTPIAVFRAAYETDWEPAMRCIGSSVTLCADVACLEVGRVDQGTTKDGPGQGGLLIAL